MNPPIGQRIAAVRRSRGMTQQQLAGEIGRKKSTASHIEQGHAWLDDARLAAICARLGVTVWQIRSPHWRKLCARGGISLEEAL